MQWGAVVWWAYSSCNKSQGSRDRIPVVLLLLFGLLTPQLVIDGSVIIKAAGAANRGIQECLWDSRKDVTQSKSKTYMSPNSPYER